MKARIVRAPNDDGTVVGRPESMLRDMVNSIHSRRVFRYTTLPDGRQLVTLSDASRQAAERALRERARDDREVAFE